MFKKIFIVLLCLTMVLLSGCGKKKNDTVSSQITSTVEEEKPKGPTNPLTGLTMTTGNVNSRPVAIMINNISFSQPVQTGINKADIIYETEVEGGISRLMAVYKDISTVGQIGSVRSARYVYVDLALGHDAVYAHCGQDNTYCKPHLSDIDHVVINTGVYGGVRINNGLAIEHTLYTYGDKLAKGIKEKGVKTTVSSNENWQNFAEEDQEVILSGGTCKKVTVPFSSSYHTVFNYNESTKKYVRYFGDTLRKDYVNGETTEMKNVFVLLTDISFYPNNYRRKVDLKGGEGYYIVNGTFTKIKWSKGDAKNPFKFTTENGSALTVNAGNSYVCIAGKSLAPTIQ